MRILIVEDDEKSRRLLCDVLEYHGFAVIAAPTGEAGLREAAAQRPDAALLDIHLPGIDGFEVLQGLRRLHAGIPVIAVTASVMDHDRARIFDAGFDAYIPKPVNIGQILQVLRDWLAPVGP